MAKITAYEYSEYSRLTKVVINGEITQTIYPDENLTIIPEEEYGAVETASVKVISNGQSTQHTEVNGVITDVTKDDGSKVDIKTNSIDQLSVTSLSKNGDKSTSYSYEYDDEGNVLKKINDGNGLEEVWGYVNNLKVSHIDMAGLTSKWEYDVRGNVTKEYVGVEDNMTLQKEYTYNSQGLIVKEWQLGTIKNYQYDYLGNLIKQTIGEGSEVETETRAFVRDSAGNILSKTEGENLRSVQYGYDGLGRISEVVEQRGKSTYTYHSSTNEVILTDILQGQHTLQTDDNGNLIKIIDPEGRAWETGYVNKDQIAWKKRPDGTTIKYDYDASGNYVREVSSTDVNQRKYCTNKNLLWAKNRLVQLTNVYNEVGHAIGSKTTYEGLNPIELSISTSASGKRESFSCSSFKLKEIGPDDQDAVEERETITMGSQQSYSYNDQGQLVKIECGSFSVEFSFDEKGVPSGINRGNNTNTITEFSSIGKLKRLSDIKDGVVIDEKKFSFDSGGNLTSVESLQSTDVYEYDANDQVTKATIQDHTLSYAYDEKGNRLQKDATEIQYSDKRILYLSDDLWHYKYDSNGYLIEKTSIASPEVVNRYEYSDLGQLIAFTKWDGGESSLVSAEYVYDPLGRRTGKKVIYRDEPQKDKTVWWVYDGENILFELDENYNLIRQYINGFKTDDVLGFKEAGSDYYYLKNIQGSIEKILDQDGNIVKSYSYDPFGTIVSQQGDSSLNNSYCFTGREWDEESETYYFRNRQYDPTIGRFLQPDVYPGKVDDPISIFNKYTYARNNPLKYHDPYGLFLVELFFLFIMISLNVVVITAGIGILAGLIVGIASDKPFWEGFNYGFKRGVSLLTGVVGELVGSFTGLAGALIGGIIGFFWDGGDFLGGAMEGWRVGKGVAYQAAQWMGNIIIQHVDNIMPDEFSQSAYNSRLAGFSAYCASLAYLESQDEIQRRLPKGFVIDIVMDAPWVYGGSLDYTDTQCFTAYNDNSIVIAFRGSQTSSLGGGLYDWIVSDLLSNLLMVNFPSSFDWGYTPQVGYGWWDAYDSVREQIRNSVLKIDNIKNSLGSNITRKIRICGHSLGGALATVCALDISRSLSREVSNYTIGSPRVGNIAFVDLYQSHVVDSHRIDKFGDPVPLVPPNFLAYYHVDKLRRIGRDFVPLFPFTNHENAVYLEKIIEDGAGTLLGDVDTRDTYVDNEFHVYDFVPTQYPSHITPTDLNDTSGPLQYYIQKIMYDDRTKFGDINHLPSKNPVNF